ncbi:MAG: 2OG-Fe(II) oxygenase family protein [Novosphingobium sp.]
MSTSAELALIQAVHARQPTPLSRARLAGLWARMAKWDEIIELLTPEPELIWDEEFLLTRAWLDSGRKGWREAAAPLAERLLARAGDADQRSAALVLRARFATLNRGLVAARADLQEALALDLANQVASIRLARVALSLGKPEEALAIAEDLSARGIRHPYVTAIRALAQAGLGHSDVARATMGQGMIPLSARLSPPPGWQDIGQFNEALAQELLAHPDLRFQRYGASPVETWGIDAPLTSAAPLLRQLMTAIAAELDRQIARLAETVSHPWLDARPRDANLHCSCVMTRAEDFEEWHIHPTGWLNGVYYVAIPEAVASGEDEAGCLGLGLPHRMIGAEAAAAYGQEIIRPQSGLMLAFPSHTYHRTFAHGCEGRRIAVTFELRPAGS